MADTPYTVRSIDPASLEAWAAVAGAPDPGLAASVRDLWASGSGRPDWTFLVRDAAGTDVGRVAIVADPVGRTVPDLEHRVVGLRLRWDDPDVDGAGRALLDHAVDASVRPGGGTVDARLNPVHHDRVPDRLRVLRGAGFALLQEKAGVLWEDDGAPVDPPARLRTEPLTEAAEASLRDAMARAGEGTLDRVDRHYRALVGPAGWATEMFGYLEDADRPSWLLARDPAGEVAGYVLLGDFGEPGTATIVHIGVVPEARGRGYGAELLAAATLAARARGFRRILSDVDVANRPMLEAMARAGHRAGATSWHVWHLRRPVPPAR